MTPMPVAPAPATAAAATIAVDELRIGMFVELDGGWLSHPFPLSSFRISSSRFCFSSRLAFHVKLLNFEVFTSFFNNFLSILWHG